MQYYFFKNIGFITVIRDKAKVKKKRKTTVFLNFV